MEQYGSAPFNGRRLRLARLFRDLTQSELAREVAASPALLSQAETGARQLRGELVDALAYVLGFEPAFFFQRIEDEFREEECNFRRRRTTPERLIKRLVAQATLFGMVVRHLQEVLGLPAPSMPAPPSITSDDDVERAAEVTREHLGLPPDTPVDSLGRVLERAGVVLAQLDETAASADAFSRFGAVSVVVLNTWRQSPSRILFDLAHELGHGVMHRGLQVTTPEIERQADRFAAAFLLPRTGFRRDFWAVGRLDWTHLFELKRRWRTSVAAMVRRAFDLRLLDPATYRRACKYMYAQGWARTEPDESGDEKPELFSLALETVKREVGDTPEGIAVKLRWKFTTFEDVISLAGAPASPSRVLSLDLYRERRQAAAP
ncbi:MAG: ImmA/IrrE family metallo-endopeptidase [Gemmatimonadetes bacterium]|nr:ImmA/IrrE family metallo-endopeptidase [Gemmatimonadota bacterium]